MSDDPRIQAAINAYLSVCDVGIDVDHEAIRAALTAADAAAWQPREMRYVHDVTAGSECVGTVYRMPDRTLVARIVSDHGNLRLWMMPLPTPPKGSEL
jgi:hypothetical protein